MSEQPTPTRITFHTDLARALPPLQSDEIRLEAGGAGWLGTFGVTARAMVNDILSDGEPITATLVVWDEEPFHPTRTPYVAITGEITEWELNKVTFADGHELLVSETLIAVTV